MRLLPPAFALLLLALPAAARDDPGQVAGEHPPARAAERLGELKADGVEDNGIEFVLATTKTLAAVERFGRELHRLGVRTDLNLGLPFLRLPVRPAADPAVVAPGDVAAALQTLADDLDDVRAILDGIGGQVEVSMPVGRMGFDFDGDGVVSAEESLPAVMRAVGLWTPRRAADLRVGDLIVDFDGSDVQWLHAYAHLLGGLLEVALAHDGGEFFDRGGHLLFARVQTPYEFLRRERGLTPATIADLAAALTAARFPVRDPDRLEAARRHFLAAARLSRGAFESIRAETDDQREWIPNGRQTAAFPGAAVSDEMIDAWLAFVGEVEEVLEGERLIPFWRGTADDNRGVNLRRVFAEQRQTDLIYWLQGTAAVPYLEDDKPVMTAESLRRFQDVTGGRAFSYAAWFN